MNGTQKAIFAWNKALELNSNQPNVYFSREDDRIEKAKELCDTIENNEHKAKLQSYLAMYLAGVKSSAKILELIRDNKIAP
jgi:hypothetical protein